MPAQWQYLALMAACLLVTLPLELVLGVRVYRQPGRLLRTVLPVAVLFTLWDLVAIDRGHWWFNPAYTSGILLPGGLPLEELVFFVVIPTCGILGYEAVGVGLERLRRRRSFPDHASTSVDAHA